MDPGARTTNRPESLHRDGYGSDQDVRQTMSTLSTLELDLSTLGERQDHESVDMAKAKTSMNPYPQVLAAMRSAVADLSQTRSLLKTLGERPDHESVDMAKAKTSMNPGLANEQFDSMGKLMHKVDTKLSAGSYGEDELISFIQT
ncbi:hypothetical protein L6452_26757 [Arctium lappa]|uniref:Uncharacterized protein n=1 Tax=Arctium lappa TaxID=4217 RepID=A0ACB8ZZK0_ARCLA|nr:hypothetical protein L6452_26757 [Arctium lappa]